MTLKQRKLAKEYIKNGGNGKEAAIAVGYAPAHAEVSASRALRAVKSELNLLMDRVGLGEKTLLEPIRNGLKANAIFKGRETRAPDHSNRLRSSELAWKLRGHLKNTDDGAAMPAANSTYLTQININASDEELSRLLHQRFLSHA